MVKKIIHKKIIVNNKEYYQTIYVDKYGNKKYYLNGKLHREDDPAVEYANGDKYWYKNGKRHREDGPAIDWFLSSNHHYLNGVYYTKKF